MKILIPEKLEEITLDLLVSSGKTNDPAVQALKILKEFNPLHKIDQLNELQIEGLAYAMGELLANPELPPVEEVIEIDGRTLRLPNHLLDIQFQFYIELINAYGEEDSIDTYHIMAACFYREDWAKPFSESEIILNARAFWSASCKFGYWGALKYVELVNLLKSTYPILYESKGQTGKSSEGVRGYQMLDALAGHDVNKWEATSNQPLKRIFRKLEQNEIQRQNEEQRKRSNRVHR